MFKDRIEAPSALFQKSAAKIRALKIKPKIKLSFSSNAITDIVMQKIQRDLKKNLDLDVELNGMEWKFFVGQTKSDALQMYCMSMGAPFMDPINHLRVYTIDPIEKTSPSKYDNPKYANLVASINKTAVGPKRSQLIQQAQSILLKDDAAVIALYQKTQMYAMSKELKNFTVSPFGVIQLGEIRR